MPYWQPPNFLLTAVLVLTALSATHWLMKRFGLRAGVAPAVWVLVAGLVAFCGGPGVILAWATLVAHVTCEGVRRLIERRQTRETALQEARARQELER